MIRNSLKPFISITCSHASNEESQHVAIQQSHCRGISSRIGRFHPVIRHDALSRAGKCQHQRPLCTLFSGIHCTVIQIRLAASMAYHGRIPAVEPCSFKQKMHQGLQAHALRMGLDFTHLVTDRCIVAPASSEPRPRKAHPQHNPTRLSPRITTPNKAPSGAEAGQLE